ncbi:MAG: ferrochelatase [Leptospira sp.]|nr:ferrochelatase [Leptospira sp.]
MNSHQNRLTLINLGGPRTTEEIEPFLRDLFLDPYVFDLPLWEPLRKKLARFIAKKRAPKVAGTYASMGYGGGSPLFDETKKQAYAIAELLQKSTGKKWETEVTMTCGYPNIRGIDPTVLNPTETNIYLPLYPQFSRSTTLSTGKIMEGLIGRCPLGTRGWVDHFARDFRFHKVVSHLILDYFQGKLKEADFIHLDNEKSISNWEEMDLVFSAHGIPMRLIKKGDTYVQEVEASIRGIETELKKSGFRGRTHLSFQSRVGPAKWTEPNTIEKLKELGAKKARIAVYPISFVGDHLETLEEIGVELRDIAMEAGAESYNRIPAPGIYPKFIQFLHDLVLESTQNPIEKKECLCKKYGGENPGCV